MALSSFPCESEEFSGPTCKVQCKSCKAPYAGRAKAIDWDQYEIRTGKDKRVGIYLCEYNVRLATFNANTFALQTALAKLFDDAARKPVVIPRKRKRKTPRVIDHVGGGAFMSDVGDQGYNKMKRRWRE
jgi:hypothetical protein